MYSLSDTCTQPWTTGFVSKRSPIELAGPDNGLIISRRQYTWFGLRNKHVRYAAFPHDK